MGEFRDYLNMVSEMSIAGYGDREFDERVWDYTAAKKDIRLILKEIR